MSVDSGIVRVSIIGLLLASLVVFGECAHGAAGISAVGYSIQVGAFAQVGNAERLAARLQERGVDAFYFKKDNGLYAVRFGDFPSRSRARDAARRLSGDGLLDSYYIAAPVCVTQRLPVDNGDKKPGTLAKPAARIRCQPSDQVQGAPVPDSDMGGIAARTAERFVGIPYRWGGTTVVEGMDCSGFVRAVYNLCGVNIPRTSREQFLTGRGVERTELRDGDLVFFGSDPEQISHVGIYIGGGRYVHAPKRGDDIKVSQLTDNGFGRKYVGARRYF